MTIIYTHNPGESAQAVNRENPFPTTLYASEGAQARHYLGQVGGHTTKVQRSFTRPADTTQYAAGDVMSSATSSAAQWPVLGCARIEGGSGVILQGMLIDSANQGTKGSFEVWLFDQAVTMDNDNGLFTPTDEELSHLVAIIPFATSYVGDATSGAGGNAVYLSDAVNRGFVCGGNTTSLWPVQVVRNAFTPISAESYTLILTVRQD